MLKDKSIQRLISFLLVVTLTFSLMELSLFSTFAANGISYNFANTKAGYAEGTISLNADSQGKYYLYWADDEGALGGYYSITSIDTGSDKTTFDFRENIVIPPGATKVIAVKGSSEPTDKSVENASYVYDIPESKQNKYKPEDRTLRFQAISDSQIDQQSSVFYTYSEKHFAQALEDAAARDVDFVTMSGDCISNYGNGTSKEWQTHQKIIADSSYTNPIFETNGNHSMNSDIQYGLQAYMTATGLGVDTDALWDNPYYEMTADNGDHFIFVALEGSSSVPTTDEFSDEQLDWLEETIQKYYSDGKHIFVFEHAFFHGWGPGDDKTQHYYSGGLRTTDEFPGNQRFKEIMDTYTEVFLYTGHSHLDFMYNWNYDNENGQTANMFHIPATACTTHVTNGKLDYTMNEKDSQCYIVESYDDMVVSFGLNVVDNLIYPQYSYIVETSDYNHQPATKETAPITEPTTESSNMIDVQVENGTSYMYDNGAALYFYNNDSGNYYPVDSSTGIAQIPENAFNLTLYRCDGSWGSGNKTDKVTTYWNKYGPATRADGQVIFYVGSSTNYSWKDGEVVYPTTTETTATESSDTKATESSETTSNDGEVTVYWAIPKAYTDLGYTFRMNLKAGDGTYPHSARIMSDTGTTYNGMEVYSYTFPVNYVAEYDTLGIQRIQMQCIDKNSKQVFQYELTDKNYTVTGLKDMIFVSADDAPTSTVKATSDSWKPIANESEESTTEAVETTEATQPAIEDNVEITVVDATSSGWVYNAGAVLFLYDKDTQNYYKVTDGIASIPKTAVNLTIYRCDGQWGAGNKTDDITTYWNKWDLKSRNDNFTVVSLTGDGASNWLSTGEYETEGDVSYYLVGYFDGEDYDGREYKFDKNGELEILFTGDSYVYVISSSNNSYWTNGWLGNSVSTAQLYRAQSLSNPDKMFIQSGKIKFSLIVNSDGTLTLSYECSKIELDKSELEVIKNIDAVTGDADGDGVVTIKDATLIQKYIAKMITDDEIDYYAADVYGNGNINVNNVTMIQRNIASLGVDFPASADYVPNTSTLEKVMSAVKDTLYTDYRYSSYVAYSKLKTLYFKYKDINTDTLTSEEREEAYADLSKAYENFNTVKSNNNVVTVYFCNDYSWSSVRAYCYNSETEKGINTFETAQAISPIKVLNCGAKIYCVTINRSKWDKIIFTDGNSKKTVVLDIPTKNYIGYYFADSTINENGEYNPSLFKYNYDRI